MNPALAERKGKKRRAPAPPNPFTGEIENGLDGTNPFDEEDDSHEHMTIDTEEVHIFVVCHYHENGQNTHVYGIDSLEMYKYSNYLHVVGIECSGLDRLFSCVSVFTYLFCFGRYKHFIYVSLQRYPKNITTALHTESVVHLGVKSLKS